MIDNAVLFESRVCIWKEGKKFGERTVQLVITINEIHLFDKKWSKVIPLNQVYDLVATLLPFEMIGLGGTFYKMASYLLVDYLDEGNQRCLLRTTFVKYFVGKTNEREIHRFNEMMERYQLRDRFIKPAPIYQDPQADVLAQIKQLAELRDSGTLTEDEFQAKKAELLKRI